MGHTSREPIHAAVSRIAAAQPDHPAVVGVDGTVLSYRDLERKAAGWSERLTASGVRAGDVVPVLVPRSPTLPVLLLAILRCGAAYAALDHRWPEARISGVLARLGAPLIVAAPEYRHIAEACGVPVWTPPPLDENDPVAPHAPMVSPEATACVFFTSGTTGEAKGVLSPHRATTRLFAPDGPMGFGPGTVMPLTTFLSWDAASLELWGMLTTGGVSVVVEDDYLTPYAITDLITRHDVNTLWLTTSLFNLLVSEDVDCFAGAGRVYVGGERLSPPHVRTFLERFPEAVLRNGYGPVESCVFATTHRVTLPDCDAGHGIPIGRPVPGTGVLVLDDDQVCGPGVPGELCLTGDGLASGYLGDEALTRAKFTDVAIEGRPLRVYRTGDLGMCDAFGVHHFLGRTDRQIKLRGQRIELDGIEAAAAAAAPLRACAAVALAGSGLSEVDRLALFYTADTPLSGRDPLGVREKLAQRLPPYAVPDLVMALERLPLTANGKVDTAALRAVPDAAPRFV